VKLKMESAIISSLVQVQPRACLREARSEMQYSYFNLRHLKTSKYS
jgi:hypothetical protein